MKNDRDVASLVRAFRPTISHVMSSFVVGFAFVRVACRMLYNKMYE